MDCYYYNGELYHHGISGQKWGVKNGPPYPLDSGSASKSNAKRKLDTGKVKSKVSSVKNKISESRSAFKEKKEIKKAESKQSNSLSNLSDSELQTIVNRMKLENKYYKETSDLKKNMASSSKGKEYFNKFKNKLIDTAFDEVTNAAANKIKEEVRKITTSKKDKDKDNKDKTNNNNNNKNNNNNNKNNSASSAQEFVDIFSNMNFASAFQTINIGSSSNTDYVKEVDEILKKAKNTEAKKK